MVRRLVLLVGLLLPLTAAGDAQITQQTIQGRNNHGAMLLTDGRVLVVGGIVDGGGKTASAEIFDPDTGTWTAVAVMPEAKARFSTVHLLDGRVVVVGGNLAGGTRVSTVAAYDPHSDVWTPLSSMIDERRTSAATRLSDGRVFVAGGNGARNRAEVFDPAAGAAGTWWDAGSLVDARDSHSQVLLDDGTVLLIGGRPEDTTGLTVERFTPGAPGATPAGSFAGLVGLTYGRADMAAVRLRPGHVLLGDGAWNGQAEIYDGSGTGSTRTAGWIGERRRRAGTALLPDGRVLIVGGTNLEGEGGRLATTEIYDPDTESYSPGPEIGYPLDRLVAVPLADGRVLQVGGYHDDGSGWSSSRSTRILDVLEDAWWAGPALGTARYGHAAVLRPEGTVLAIGGLGSGGAPLGTVERLDTTVSWPEWSPAPALLTPRGRPVAEVLADGSVLVAGGENSTGSLASVEILRPGSGSWEMAEPMSVARSRHRSVLLTSGEILVTGGIDAAGEPTATVERWDPWVGAWRPAAPMAVARARHTATLLTDGRVLVTGGEGDAGRRLDEAEIYDPYADVWTPAGVLPAGRRDHRAVLLPRGRVLVSGGEGEGGALGDAALFDPVSDAWLTTPAPALARRDHVLEVLPGGRILAAFGQPDGVNTTERYDPAGRLAPDGPDTGVWTESPPVGTMRFEAAVIVHPLGWTQVIGGRSAAGTPWASTVYHVEGRGEDQWWWRPWIDPPAAPARSGADLALEGEQLTPTYEGSFGGFMASPANHPVFTFRRNGGGGIVRPLARSFDDGSAILALPEDRMPAGWWWISPSVLGVLGRGQSVYVQRAERLVWGPAPAEVTVGTCFGPLPAHPVDPLGDPVYRASDTPIGVSDTEGLVTFHSDSTCSSATTGGVLAAGSTSISGYVLAESVGETVLRMSAADLVAAERPLRILNEGDEPVPPEGAPEIVRDANPVAAVGHPYLYGADRRARADGDDPITWRVLEGPAGYTIDAQTGEVRWTPDVAGEVDVAIEATNEAGTDVYAYSVEVVADAPPPIPVIQATPASGPAPLTVELDGSGSEAADGSAILSWRWELGDGSGIRSEPVVTHTYVQPRGHTVRLTVHDRYGVSASETAHIVVDLDGAVPPSARIVASDIHSDGSLTTDLSCACFAGSNPIVDYAWDLGDGTTSRESEVRHTYGPGSHEVVLTVVDAAGLEAVDRITLTISEGGTLPPVLVAQATPVAGEAPLEVSFSASHADPAGGELEPEWVFGDGTVLLGDVVSARFEEAGTHRVTVSVTGATGLRASRALEITVYDLDHRVRPRIVSLPRTDAAVGEAYAYDETGRPLARGSRPMTWSLGKRVGEALVGAPEGMMVDPETGALDWVPGDEAAEVYVVLVARNDVGSAVQAWTIAVDGARALPDDPSCDCTAAGGGSIAWAFGLVLLAGSRRRRRVQHPGAKQMGGPHMA